MSLQEAYYLAHSAQCRLNLEASRPDRHLRFVVGHLMHYESLRLRIVEIEHDIGQHQRTKAVQFKGTGHVNAEHAAHRKPSTGQLGRRSPPPPAQEVKNESSEESDLEDDQEDVDAHIIDDADDDDLSLTRFPSGSAAPPRPPPDLEPDDEDYDDDDEPEPHSPEEPDRETLDSAMKGESNDTLATIYEGVRRCPCHGKTDAPHIERIWDLPATQAGEGGRTKEGVTRAVAQVTV